jgi:hypothetical protein
MYILAYLVQNISILFFSLGYMGKPSKITLDYVLSAYENTFKSKTSVFCRFLPLLGKRLIYIYETTAK